MSLKEFCMALQNCANKLEEEIRYNINDIHNLIYSNQLNETKMSLEKAKDYHYKEIMDSIGEILKCVKKILFHQDKIEWLSNESNFSKDELRRFSYVKRQVFAFSNNEQAAPLLTHRVKKELRRTASEVSVGSLEAWEKYLDQKDKEEKQIEEKAAEIKPHVSKRILPNARRRKKFVSSTLGGFLEGDETKRNLDSIFEDSSSTEENERLSYSRSLESLNQMVLGEGQNNNNYSEIPPKSKISQRRSLSNISLSENRQNVFLKGSLESLHVMTCDYGAGSSVNAGTDANAIESITRDKELKSLGSSNKSVNVLTMRTDENSDVIKTDENSDVIRILNESKPKDEDSIKNEIMNTFLNETITLPSHKDEKNNVEEPAKKPLKPKIVDVIYKKKPS